MPTAAAIRLARDLGLDLVEVVGTRNPMVAKILDWNQMQNENRKVEGWRGFGVAGISMIACCWRGATSRAALCFCTWKGWLPTKSGPAEVASWV